MQQRTQVVPFAPATHELLHIAAPPARALMSNTTTMLCFGAQGWWIAIFGVRGRKRLNFVELSRGAHSAPSPKLGPPTPKYGIATHSPRAGAAWYCPPTSFLDYVAQP